MITCFLVGVFVSLNSAVSEGVTVLVGFTGEILNEEIELNVCPKPIIGMQSNISSSFFIVNL